MYSTASMHINIYYKMYIIFLPPVSPFIRSWPIGGGIPQMDNNGHVKGKYEHVERLLLVHL